MVEELWELDESDELVELDESTELVELDESEGGTPAVDIVTPQVRTMAISLTGYNCGVDSNSSNVIKEKTESSKLDYKFDWKALTNGYGPEDWLSADEYLTLATVTVPTGITKSDVDRVDTNTTVIVWLEDGVFPYIYDITCYIETNLGRKETKTMTIRMVPKKSG